ncbi:MAG TPA: MFS transporter [Caulobacter sp.]|nr:MFS transporter [Caulobacter sp.]
MSARSGKADGGLAWPRRAVATAAVLTSMALVVLDASVANIALPTIARSLRVAPPTAVLVMTAYQTALVIALLPCGALGERYGYRRMFTWGVTIFTLASALCALAPSLPWLVAARFLQGLGGAGVMALGVALLRFSVPRGRLGSAIGWNAMTVALSSAAGPTIGALVLTGADWPWLFALNLPLGVVVLFASRALPPVIGRPQAIDLGSVLLNALLFASLVVGAELLPDRPALAVGLFAVAALGLAALVQRESPKATPLFPLDLLRSGAFRVSVIASVCCFAGQSAGLLALPFQLQAGLGQTPLTTGLYMTVWPLAVAGTAIVVSRLADRASMVWLCAAGGAGLAAGLLALALWPLENDLRPLIPMTALCGVGFGLFQAANNRNLFLSAPPERSGAAGGMQGTARLTGQTAGAVLVTLLFATTSVEATPTIAFGIGAALALAAGLVSLHHVRVH